MWMIDLVEFNAVCYPGCYKFLFLLGSSIEIIIADSFILIKYRLLIGLECICQCAIVLYQRIDGNGSTNQIRDFIIEHVQVSTNSMYIRTKLIARLALRQKPKFIGQYFN